MKTQKSYSISGIILFLLSLVYLGAELVFNRQLLDVSSSVRSDPEQVDHIQYFGRASCGLGFTLLVQGIFQQFGFRIVKKKHWAVFSAITLLCMMPFLLTLGQTFYEAVTDGKSGDVPYTEDMAWGFLPFAGLFFVLAGRGLKPFAVVVGLIFMTWPAMFYGEKIAVERFIISPTTVEDRLNAHYVLLLRSGIEDCIIQLEGTQFCDGDAKNDVEKRSTRAVLGSLFMLNTGAVFDGLSFSRDQLIDSISAQDMWFSSKEYYQKYLQQVADKREQYEQFLNDSYYLPYKQASDLYLKTYNKAASFYAQASQPGRFESIAEDAAHQVQNLTELGWQQYQRAVSTYTSLSSSAEAQAQASRGIYDRLCNGHEALCKRFIGKEASTANIDEAMSQMQAAADEKFFDETGYPPDIKDISDFIRNQKTQDEIRTHVEDKIQEHIDGYALPAEWLYDPATFKDEILQILRGAGQSKALEAASQVQQAWRDRVQSQFKTNIQPGLSREDFFKRLGGDPLPPLKDLVMSEDDFRKKYIVPVNRQIADKTIEDMKSEAPSYANRQELAEKGKDYIRVLYIPAIALCLSIMIVVITIGRYATSVATDATKKAKMFRGLTRRQRNMIRPGYWVVYLTLAAILPYQWPNPYISTKAYQKYYHLARAISPVKTQLLDWVVHVQPIIYRAGAVMPDIAYIKDAPGKE